MNERIKPKGFMEIIRRSDVKKMGVDLLKRYLDGKTEIFVNEGYMITDEGDIVKL